MKESFLPCRYADPKVLIHYRKSRFQGLLDAGYTLNKIVAACHGNIALLVLYHLQDFHTCNFAFPLVNLSTATIMACLTAPRKNVTVIHCQISPDDQFTAILFYSRNETTLLFSYDLYLYCNESEKIVDCITISHEVQPYVVFDPRYKWSRVAIANYECQDVGIKHELVTYSVRDHAVVVRSNMSLTIIFGSSHFNMLFSKDGQFLILQKLSDNRFGVAIYSDIYIFDSDRLFVMKYLTCNLPALSSICRMNFEPVFSRCGSYMRLVDHKSCNGDMEPTVQIYQVPRQQSLQYHCRVVIVQALRHIEDIHHLPLPKTIKKFLAFEPIDAWNSSQRIYACRLSPWLWTEGPCIVLKQYWTNF